ncbi:MAG: DUF5060 domain-containing protein [Roseibacillus sp.]
MKACFSFLLFLCLPLAAAPKISGELQQWHKVTLTFDGPQTSETASPNPFTDFRLDLTFTQGKRSLLVPGYFAADGDAANTSATEGNKWRVHFSPPTTGEWTWRSSFRTGEQIAVTEAPSAGSPTSFDGTTGTLTIAPSNKVAPDFRALGHLVYDGTRYPKTLGTNKTFLKAGSDAPENFLSYADFDGDFASDGIKDHLVKTWQPHLRDWNEGDPVWQKEKGKGMIGALNYLSSKGMNAFSFLTMNIGGDDANVFPYLDSKQLDRLDVSRLAQWEIVFSHATSKGLFLHFKTQETENELLLDNGDLGPQRRLYYRELIARFAHHPGLNWNMGEENGRWKNKPEKPFQTTEQRLAMGRFMQKNDPYQHPIVIHNGQWYDDLYGPDSPYNGASLQTANPEFKNVHRATHGILQASAKKGKQWMVACDEPGDAQHSLVPDSVDPEHNNARTGALWGNFLAGGWGIEWYFGYAHPHSDLTCQDYRSRDLMWDQSRHALEFFKAHNLPLGEMENNNSLLSHKGDFCLTKPGNTYLLLLKNASQPTQLDLAKHEAEYTVRWFNPRNGGPLQTGSKATISGHNKQDLGAPPADPEKDWVVLITRN